MSSTRRLESSTDAFATSRRPSPVSAADGMAPGPAAARATRTSLVARVAMAATAPARMVMAATTARAAQPAVVAARADRVKGREKVKATAAVTASRAGAVESAAVQAEARA